MADPEALRLLSEGRKAWETYRNISGPESIDLSNADLTDLRIVGYNLAGADLTGVNANGVLMASADFDRAILDNANLASAILGGAKMRRASLRNANLAGADLRGAKLDGTDLTGADLTDANLDGCRLVDATLDHAIVGANLDQAIILDSKKVWPELADKPIHTLELRIETDRWPKVVTLLIDDQDVLGLEGHTGFDPDQLFANSDPLLPSDPARRVAVYQCSCGFAACGVLAPLIIDTGPTIEWRDFRDFNGVYTEPDIDRPNIDINPSGGRKLAIPDLRFDAERYRAEVARATLNR